MNRSRLTRPLLVGATVFTSAFLPGCSGGFPVPSSDCRSSQLKLAGAHHPSMLVDPSADRLVLKVVAGETRTISLTSASGEACDLGFLYDPATRIEWRSSDPTVATVTDLGADGVGGFGEIHGVAPGIARVSAVVDGGAVTRMTYYCCGTCESPEPPPRCAVLPIDHVEVTAE